MNDYDKIKYDSHGCSGWLDNDNNMREGEHDVYESQFSFECSCQWWTPPSCKLTRKQIINKICKALKNENK